LCLCSSLWNITTRSENSIKAVECEGCGWIQLAERWENSIKAVEYEGCGWIQLAEDMTHVCEHGNDIFGSINTGNL
jgi:Zn ribbon nucleic-acid-binding protein